MSIEENLWDIRLGKDFLDNITSMSHKNKNDYLDFIRV